MRKRTLFSPAKFLVLFVFLFTAGTGAVQADNSSTKKAELQVQEVVNKMNQAFSEKDISGVLATFSDNAVRFNLYHTKTKEQIHSEFSNNQVSDLASMWKSIAKVLFSSTEFYERRASKMNIQVDKNMASVWATIDTQSKSKKEGSNVTANSFSEVYLLRLTDGEWKISAMTNNRKDTYSDKKTSTNQSK